MVIHLGISRGMSLDTLTACTFQEVSSPQRIRDTKLNSLFFIVFSSKPTRSSHMKPRNSCLRVTNHHKAKNDYCPRINHTINIDEAMLQAFESHEKHSLNKCRKSLCRPVLVHRCRLLIMLPFESSRNGCWQVHQSTETDMSVTVVILPILSCSWLCCGW